MKNIQVIGGAVYCVYDVVAATDDEFAAIFSTGCDIAFIDEVCAQGNAELLDAAFEKVWKRQVRKADVLGIHGTLFYQLEEMKVYYPTRRDDEAMNPDGTAPR